MACVVAKIHWSVVISAAVFVAAAAYAPNIRPDPQLQDFILRICLRHGLPLPRSFFSQPMSVGDLQPFFRMADSLEQAGVLSRQETLRLRNARTAVNGDRAAYVWKRDDLSGRLHVGMLGGVDGRFQDSAGVRARGTLRPGLTGNVGPFSCFSEVAVSTDYWSDTLFRPSTYQPYDGVPYNLYGRASSSHLRSTDILRGGVRYALTRLDLETSIDHLKLGPALHSPLTLSGATPPETYFRGRLDMGVLDYVHMFGQLRAQKDKPKYFYAHRLDIPLLRDRLRVGVNEVIVNGSTVERPGADSLRPSYYGEERTLEWGYLIPFVPYAFAEHYMGDRDNKTISFDLNLAWPAGLRWYGELFLDDITAPWTILSSDWGNKWAVTAGAQYFGVLLGRDVQAAVEYSRVEPWVYTHFYGESHSYTHFGQPLGAPLGPNSDMLRVKLESEVAPALSLALTLDNCRWNHTARGGTITDVFQDSVVLWNGRNVARSAPDSPVKRFLGPGTVTTTEAGLLATVMALQLFHMTAHAAVGVREGRLYLALRAAGGLEF